MCARARQCGRVGGEVTGQGHQIFVDELTRLAAGADDPRLARIATEVAGPLRVVVRGRSGVGSGTVARALSAAGVTVTSDSETADVDVHVIAEVVKPEDSEAVATSRRPALVVLNKADLTGFGAGGPVVAAQGRCVPFSALTGRPTEPMVALLAVAALEDGVLDDAALVALRLLVTEPADLRSTDGFASGPHRLSLDIRARLLDTLDLFGIAHSVRALRQGRSAAVRLDSLRAVLRRVSRVDTVVARITVIGAEAHYRRMLDAVARLEALAITEERIAGFLAADDTVIARMTAAVDVVEAAGLTVDPAADPAAHLRRALRWRRYGRGPVTAAHRACGSDIARGSLRLWARAAGRCD